MVFFDKALARDFAYRVKQAGQLSSKMRFISAPWLGLLENDVWLRNARHANAMARLLHERIRDLPGVRALFPVEANAVFVELPESVAAALREKGWRFYHFIGAGGCRFMCAWDTQPETIEAFAADLAAYIVPITLMNQPRLR
jgi:threonine aldolase